MKRSRSFWAIDCKMTCLGGSEKGHCACQRPIDCVAQHDPYYEAERNKAKYRMLRHLRNSVAVRER